MSHCMWFATWTLANKKPCYAYAKIQEIFMLGYFPLQPIKNTMLSSSRGQDIFQNL